MWTIDLPSGQRSRDDVLSPTGQGKLQNRMHQLGIKRYPVLELVRRSPRECFQTLYFPVCCEEDPPQPPLKRGEHQLKVPFLRGI